MSAECDSIAWCEDSDRIYSISGVPLHKDKRFDESTANEYNSELYTKFLVSDKTMLLAVSHQVNVGEVSSKGRRSKSTKNCKYALSLI